MMGDRASTGSQSRPHGTTRQPCVRPTRMLESGWARVRPNYPSASGPSGYHPLGPFSFSAWELFCLAPWSAMPAPAPLPSLAPLIGLTIWDSRPRRPIDEIGATEAALAELATISVPQILLACRHGYGGMSARSGATSVVRSPFLIFRITGHEDSSRRHNMTFRNPIFGEYADHQPATDRQLLVRPRLTR